jgi:hypothetical protein
MSAPEMQAGRIFPVRQLAGNRAYHRVKTRLVHAWTDEKAEGWPDDFRLHRSACGRVSPLVRWVGERMPTDAEVTCPGCRATLTLTGAER